MTSAAESVPNYNMTTYNIPPNADKGKKNKG